MQIAGIKEIQDEQIALMDEKHIWANRTVAFF